MSRSFYQILKALAMGPLNQMALALSSSRRLRLLCRRGLISKDTRVPAVVPCYRIIEAGRGYLFEQEERQRRAYLLS